MKKKKNMSDVLGFKIIQVNRKNKEKKKTYPLVTLDVSLIPAWRQHLINQP